MNRHDKSPLRFTGQHAGILALLPFLLLASCAAAPFLIPAGIEFARNLLVTGNKNYGGKYSDDMNRLMVRLTTPYVAMGLPMGTSPAALVPPAMLQQQQAMMNQMGAQQGMSGQYGMGGYGGYVDPYNPTGAMPGAGYPPGGYGQQAYGYGGMSGYGGVGGYGSMQSSPYGYQGQMGGYADPNNPYASMPGMNVQAPAYGMSQYGGQYGAQYGGQFGGQYGGQMGGFPPQPGYPGAQGLPPQPGYPAAAPGMAAAPAPGYPPQGMQGYGQQPVQPGMYQQPMDPYQQQAMQGYQQQSMQQGAMAGYQQQAMQQGVPGGYQQQLTQGYQQPVAAQPYAYQGQAPSVGVGYPGQIYPRSVPGPVEPVTLDVALIRQVNSVTGKQVTLIQDGETLKDGPDGDRFKLVVRTNCECFVYVVSIDGSGWAQAVFPLANGTVTNPLKPEIEQAFPDGPYWFTLDQIKGVETLFLVASPARRTDLEESLAQLAGQQRPAPQSTAQVEEPAVIPNGFGKVQAGHATQVRDEAQQTVQVTALSYVAAKPGDDVRVTRWFKHQ